MIIAHRINKLDSETQDIFQVADGIEFDVRDSGGKIIVTHDPFTDGQRLEDFLTHCDPSKFYIVNIKSEGIEYKILELLKEYSIKNFFFLDCSIPMMVKLGKQYTNNLAVRFSEYESIETVKKMAHFVKWVWIDTFTKIPITQEQQKELNQLGLKLCFVSPELQQQPNKVNEYIQELEEKQIKLDAVCCKTPFIDAWINAPSLRPS
jgi:hypothetical protein